MLLVVLGAGASYDSLSPDVVIVRDIDKHCRPPLADGLCSPEGSIYGDALDQFPSCVPIVDRLRRSKGRRSLEEELDLIVADAEHVPALHRQLLGFRYYVRSVILGCTAGWLRGARGVTNYVTLVAGLEQWRARRSERVVFVSFNYDLLLERALIDVVGARFNTIDDYIGREDYIVVKPHGSVNWARAMLNRSIISGSDRAPDVIDWAAEAKWSDAITVVPDGPLNRGGIVNARVYAPALTVPLRNKATFECPEEHLRLLGERLPDVDRALIIGWRGLEQHFTETLSHIGLVLPTITVVTESTESSFETLHNVGPSLGSPTLRPAPGYEGGFSHFLQVGGLSDVLL